MRITKGIGRMIVGSGIVLLLLISFGWAEESMAEFDLIVSKNEEVSLEKIRTFKGAQAEPENYTDYRLDIQGKGEQKVGENYLPVSFYVLDPWEEVEEAPVSVRVPYVVGYEKVKVYHKENLIHEEDISYLCQENGVCEEKENFVSCPKDCPPGGRDGLCNREEEGSCDPDCLRGDPDCEERGIFLRAINIISLGGILIAGFLLLMTFLKFRRTEDELEGEKLRRRINLLIIIILGCMALQAVVLVW